MKRRNLAIIAILLSTVIVASALSTIDINPKSKKIKIGKTGQYEIILKTDVIGLSKLDWETDSPDILASIGGQPPGQTGSFDFNSNGKTQVFKIDVTPQAGAVVGKTYHVKISFLNTNSEVEATVTGDVVPTPELATGLLMITGLVGLFGIARFKRKKE